MYEPAWNSIKAKDFKSAYRSLDLMLLQDPDSAQAPRAAPADGQPAPAPDATSIWPRHQFTQTLDEYEPIYRELAARLDQAKTDPKYFDQLLGKGLDKFDIAAVFPKAAPSSWCPRSPTWPSMLVVAEELGTLQRGIKESEELLDAPGAGGGQRQPGRHLPRPGLGPRPSRPRS